MAAEFDAEKEVGPAPQLDEGSERMVVVDHLPVVTADKYEKLLRVVTRALASVGPLAEPHGAYLPRDDDGRTKGYGFFEFASADLARKAVAKMQDYAFDRAHVFRVYPFADFERVLSAPEEFVAPPIRPYVERENFRSWLYDPEIVKGADDFLVQYGENAEVLRNMPKMPGRPEPQMRRERFTELFARWSPQGTFLASVHRQGILLWAGKPLDKQPRARLPHPEVSNIAFSPQERFVVTRREPLNKSDPQAIFVWDLKSGSNKPIHAFQTYQESSQRPRIPTEWKCEFKFSFDEKFMVRLGKGQTADAIEIYELPTMKASLLKLPGVSRIAMSPLAPIVAYYIPETGNTPARIALYDLKSKKELRTHNIFRESNCSFHWHPNGTFLCAQVDSLAGKGKKSKKAAAADPAAAADAKPRMTHTFVVFRLTEKGIPFELVEEPRDTLLDVAWEPSGTRLCHSATDMTSHTRVQVLFHDFGTPDLKAKLIKKLDKRPANRIFWSPSGGKIIFADLESSNGAIEFVNCDAGFETLGSAQHFNATSVEWDPSGRYVAVVTSHWRNPTGDCGFNLFTFFGTLIQKMLKDRFYQLLWRPRPPSLLTHEQQEAIRKNLKVHRLAFLKDEEREKEELRRRERAKIEAEHQAFNAMLADSLEEYKRSAAKRRELRGGYDSESEDLFIETERDFVEVLTYREEADPDHEMPPEAPAVDDEGREDFD